MTALLIMDTNALGILLLVQIKLHRICPMDAGQSPVLQPLAKPQSNYEFDLIECDLEFATV